MGGALPKVDDPVVSVGNSNDSDFELNLLMAPLGGKVFATYVDQNSSVGGMQICHDSPLRKGNSGGPLINLKGRLVGVNYAQCLSIEVLLRRKRRCGYAVRPDIEWLADLIDQDHAALSGKKERDRLVCR